MEKIATFAIVALAATLVSATGGSSLSRVKRVINGDKASIEKYSFYAGISFPYHKEFCGGSIISKTWILTAAHCAISKMPDDIIIRVGSDDKHRKVAQIKVHPSYDNANYVFDYALLKLKIPLEFGSRVSPIQLGKSRDLIKGAVGTLIGRGFSNLDYDQVAGQPLRLRFPFLKAQLTITGIEACEQGKRDENNALPDSLVPAYRKYTICSRSFKSPPQSSCEGDSGGPFIVKGRLAGVVSEGFHPKGCRVRHSGVIINSSASVPAVRSWILRETRGATSSSYVKNNANV